MELEINLHTSSILFQKDPCYKSQFCTKIRAPSRLVSEFWAKYKDVPTKIDKDFELNRKTNQRMMNVCKQLLKSFEPSAEETSFQIMRFCFQF